MFKDRYTVGNVCLVVFLAFIFSAMTAMVKVPPASSAPSAPPVTMYPETSPSNTYDADTKKITLWVQLNPVTPVDFGTLKYYVTLLDEAGTTLLSSREYTYKQAIQAVYQTAYGRLLRLEYTSPTPIHLAPTFTVAYRSVYSGLPPLAVYLELTYKPPAAPPPSDVGVPSNVVATAVGDITLSTNQATLDVSVNQFMSVTSGLPADAVYRLPVSLLSIRPAMQYSFPVGLLDVVGSRMIQIPADGAALTLALDMIPRPSFVLSGATLSVTVSRVSESEATVGFGEVYGTGASVDYTPVTSGYRIDLAWVSPTGRESVTWSGSPKQPFKLTLGYDPTKVQNPERLVGVHKDSSGNVNKVSRTVVRPDASEADLYIDRLSWFALMQWRKEFTDTALHWAYNDIVAMAARAVAMGMPDGSFAPDARVTRAQFAALLTRTLGKSPAEPAGRFSDVRPWAWYYDAVETAASLGLVKGYENGTFKPDAQISRQEMATMVTRAMGLLKTLTALDAASVDATLLVFADTPNIGTWAKESVAQAVKAGIVQGRTPTTFQPAADSTRAESVVMLKRLLKASGYIQ
ncbi:MAG: S-layer homology domain-containing protein [Bacillota bacterium]|nr:S-layer homology domain-containing protein [Bacillota bacterium]